MKLEQTIDYYEAARIAYTDWAYMEKFIDGEIDIEEINKEYRPIWQFTYKGGNYANNTLYWNILFHMKGSFIYY